MNGKGCAKPIATKLCDVVKDASVIADLAYQLAKV